MNVQELMELLKDQDPTAEVVVLDDETDDYFTPDVVKEYQFSVEHTEEFHKKLNEAYTSNGMKPPPNSPVIMWRGMGFNPGGNYKALRLDKSRVAIGIK